MAPSALLDLSARGTGLAYGGYTIQLPTGKYIGRADFETQIYAPKPIIVRDTPYVWTVKPFVNKAGKKHYNLIAGAAAGKWTAEGNKVIKQANETIAGNAKSGAWYVHKQDEFSPVLAGGKGASKAVPFSFVAQIPIEGPGGIARDVDSVPGPVQIEIV
ncbi:unnamed protein product [Tilletia caries]|nr:unnamed protein product [Tilletia caries]